MAAPHRSAPTRDVVQPGTGAPRVVATDLDSTNGTFVDGKRISGATGLQPGVVLQIGPYRLAYQVAEPEEAAEVTMRAMEATGNITSMEPARRRSLG